MAVKTYILQAGGRLDLFLDIVQKALQDGIEKVEKVLPFADVDVVVDADAQATIPEVGVGGYSPHAHQLLIHIDPDFPKLADELEGKIKSTLAHELHHCARWYACGYGTTLLEAVVSEGLADHFDIEINGNEPKAWNIALSEEQLGAVMEKAKKEFSNPTYNHSAWFFGSDEIPRWAGYSLGFRIVGEYLKKTGKKASELYAEKAETFIA